MKKYLSPTFIIENMNVSLIIIDANDNILEINKAAEFLFKKSKKEVINKNIHELITNFSILNIRDFILYTKLNSVKRNILIDNQQNSIKIGITITIVPIFGQNNTYTGAIITCVDISDKLDLINQLVTSQIELKKQSAQTTEERDKFQLVIQSVNEGILILDENYNIYHSNSAIREIIGVTQNKLTYAPLKKYFKEIYNSDLIKNHDFFKAIEIENYDKNTNLKVHLAPILVESGEKIHFVLTLIDITKQKELDEMKNQFVANVSHELRTPLSTIKGFISTLLARKNLSLEQTDKFLGIIDRESDRLTRLIEDLLSLSRIESKSFDLHFSEFDLMVLLEEIKEAMIYQMKAKNINLTIIGENELPNIIANKDNIQQLFLNLINNAVKFTYENTEIEIKIIFKHNAFIINIKDQGPGIAQENFSKIFEKFFRVEDTSHTIQGSGLGLSIAKTIIENHKGKIHVQSTLGNGATFIIEIPQGKIIKEKTLQESKYY